MKLQHIAIVFVIIILPISIIMSAYIQNQITAIEFQTALDSNLINATYDAVKAFQLNTTNNKYSSISDSKIRDVEASVNTFYNVLNTSMKDYSLAPEDLEGYIPAILFTLYDGYYIYTSYDNVYNTTGEGEDEKVDIQLGENNYQNGLKPYVYYSAKYRLRNGNIIVVNFTLDNEITVYGDFGDGYVTKSGYLINPDLVTINEQNGSITSVSYDGIEIRPEMLWEHLITTHTTETNDTVAIAGDYPYIFYQNDKIYQDRNQETGELLYNEDGTPRIFWYNNYTKTYVNNQEIREYARQCGMHSISAMEYYIEAKEFSEWVRDNLGDITQANTIMNEDGTTPYSQSPVREFRQSDKIFFSNLSPQTKQSKHIL